MPTRPLPSDPNLDQLKAQAKDLLRDARERSLAAAQRLREFHPRFRHSTDADIVAAALKLSDAQLAIAREYGFASWPRLKRFVEDAARDDLSLPKHARIKDAAFRRAVDLLDDGDEAGLREFLREHPRLVKTRVELEGANYFTSPALLEFVAENPTRRGTLPSNAAAMARVVLEAGAKDDRAAIDETLGLVASSAVARTSGVKAALIDVLCDYGADPTAALRVAVLHGEFDALEPLVRRGAAADLVVAAATGNLEAAQAALAGTDRETLQRALAMAAQHGNANVVRLLLDAGADPNRYAPVGGHSHATPLHQAALGGHEAVVRLLVERGARTDLRDIHHNATPLEWAEYGNQEKVAEYLSTVARHPQDRSDDRSRE